MTTPTHWQQVNQRLMARTLAECSFEGLLTPQPDAAGWYRLDTPHHRYRFRARRTPWDYLWIAPDSIERDGFPASDALQLVLDCAPALAMSAVTLGRFLEELNNTLTGDLIRQQRLARYQAAELIDLPELELEGLLDGHPKVLANRGRIGWGLDALRQYSPEAGQPLRLRWLAAHRASGVRVFGQPAPEQCLTEPERQELAEFLDSDDWHLLPVHPWQWQQYLAIQYAAQVHAGTLMDLGERGYHYRPQQSIRTLSNASCADHCDLKLALSILNTSCYRGIPADTLALAPALSQWLSAQAVADPVLAAAGLSVQLELGSLHLPHLHQHQVAGTPYRYRELLGAVWRQSLASLCADGERGWIFAVLMQKDARGGSLIAELIRRSTLSPEQWLTRLFDRVTVPLYHLLCQYGVGLVAHGQNLGVIFRNHQPERVVIKDFHGDLRITDDERPEQAGLPDQLATQLGRLPARHLLHDFYTGHLVTGLRFVSPLLEDELGFPESRFYQLLAERLQHYQSCHPHLAEQFRRFDLFRPNMERVCLNRVRFRTGYSDDAERPRPELGPTLPNPLSVTHSPTLEHHHG